MCSKLNSTASTYCSEAEAITQGLRRSQRLSEKPAAVEKLGISADPIIESHSEPFVTGLTASTPVLDSCNLEESEGLIPLGQTNIQPNYKGTLEKGKTMHRPPVERRAKRKGGDQSTPKRGKPLRSNRHSNYRRRTKIKHGPDKLSPATGLKSKGCTDASSKLSQKRKTHTNCQNEPSFERSHRPPVLRYYDAGDAAASSRLPAQYPPHFTHQLPPNSVQVTNQKVPFMLPQGIYQDYNLLNTGGLPGCYQSNATLKNVHEQMLSEILNTPDTTPHLSDSIVSSPNANESSTTPSLPSSLQELFDAEDMRDALEIDRIQYRLTEQQVTAVAHILSLEPARLRGVINFVHNLKVNELNSLSSQMPSTEGCIDIDDIRNTSPQSAQIIAANPAHSERRHFSS